MTDPKVTIVVPAYNSAETVAETIASLAAQTYSNLEVIVVNDGSKDATGEVAKKSIAPYSSRMRYLEQTNAGQAAALNNGWVQAAGDFLGYLSADDIMYPQAVERIVAFLTKNPQVCAAYPDYDLIDANSKPIRLVTVPEFSAFQLIEHSICQPGPGALFRKSAYAKTGGWNRELRLTPDFDFWVRMSRSGEMARVPETLAGFRVHEGSQSFAVPNEAKSEEATKVIAAYFAGGADLRFSRQRAMAWAHVLSARLHLRAGRWAQAIGHLSRSVSNDKSVIMHKRFWHLLASGAFGRLRYRLSSATTKS